MTVGIANAEHERFHVSVGSCSFKYQFAEIYLARFKAVRAGLVEEARRRWNRDADEMPPVRSLADLKHNEDCIIIGTLFRESAQKPSIIKQLADLEQIGIGGGAKAVVTEADTAEKDGQLSRLAGDNDELFLEDEVQRISLCVSDDFIRHRLVTGVVVCLRGSESENSQGSFTVVDVAFLEPKPQSPIAVSEHPEPFPPHLPLEGSKWAAFVSGLGFTGSAVGGHHAFALRLLGDWLRGGGTRGPLRHLFILGDSIRAGDPGDNEVLGLIEQARFLARKSDADSVVAMAAFDAWLSELPLGQGGLCVEILPGPSDCVSQLLPQQPLHPILLPKAIARTGGGVRSSTNPCLSQVGSRRILATSGQTVTDVYRYTKAGGVLDCMESLLHWGHMAPTCPDTLYGYPLADRDLLLLRTDGSCGASPDYPDIFVAGNQPVAQWRRASLEPWRSALSTAAKRDGSLLISVPRFDSSHTIVLLELESLRCLPLRFDQSEIS
uniref:DNA polymerase II subunit 2 n=1 Tax=Mesocestoides corti TaxID=53468 RepID=A0A5K3FS18_MESCO